MPSLKPQDIKVEVETQALYYLVQNLLDLLSKKEDPIIFSNRHGDFWDQLRDANQWLLFKIHEDNTSLYLYTQIITKLFQRMLDLEMCLYSNMNGKERWSNETPMYIYAVDILGKIKVGIGVCGKRRIHHHKERLFCENIETPFYVSNKRYTNAYTIEATILKSLRKHRLNQQSEWLSGIEFTEVVKTIKRILAANNTNKHD